MRPPLLRLIGLPLVLLIPAAPQAQQITVAEGSVRDSLSGTPLPYASVVFEDSSQGTATDSEGSFHLQSRQGYARLTVRLLGYETKTVPLQPGAVNRVEVLLPPVAYELEHIVVRPGRERYTRRNNPAVELIRNVIEHKQQNRIEAQNEYKVEVYEKLSLALDYPSYIERSRRMKPFAGLKNYVDTSEFTGKPVLTLSIRESLADRYYRKTPRQEKQTVRASRRQGIDRTLDESGTISENLKEIFRDVNLFDNDVALMINRFVSPLSSVLATAYYKYYLLDTLHVAGEPCVSLAFAPFNSQSYGFTGVLYITLDGSYAVKKAQLNAPRHIHLNWVNKLRIEQEFARTDSGTWALSLEHTYATFAPVPGTPQLYAHRLRSFKGYNFAPGAAEPELPPDSFRREYRHIPLPEKEDELPNLLAELKRIPPYNAGIKTFEILVSDHVPTHPDKERSRFDFGPLSSTFSSNYVEGFRMRAGGMTTANLHPQWMASGYIAYGWKDRRPKYRAGLIYNFAPRIYHEKEFPVHYLSLTHRYDMDVPGRRFLFTDNDHLALSFSAGAPVTRMQYLRTTELQYEKEWLNHLSLLLWAKHEYSEAAGALEYLRYEPDGNLLPTPGFTTSEAGIRLRYAPGEKAYNSRKGRHTVFNLSKDAPVFTLSHRTGLGGIFGDYRYHHTEAGFGKRFWLSSFGHIDAVWKAGYLWNRVPFPLLILPSANPSLSIQAETFAMMRPMEFVADRYTSFFLTYYMKGWILNRIPLVRRLALREVLSISGLYGSLYDKNNPQQNPEGLFAFPDGTKPLGATPYLEASVGLDNIFRILRIDYYRRLSPPNPGISPHGFRIAMRFTF
ncbi:MAG: DUF5686 and carboxypeptidase regulatory-like domain-containing protein [Tannerellaceae bacterium]|jgi:hypothetical protein|nr:DUF5686 and carboxypeptidase regulatory-like domain-containing protein [Tannerellaceae bacterium]